MEESLDVSRFLEGVYGDALESWTLRGEKKMGFSGAVIAEVECTWKADAAQPPVLFLKHIVPLALADDATPAARVKAARDVASYVNECRFLRDFAPVLRANDITVPVVLHVSESPTAFAFTTLSESQTGDFTQLGVCPPYAIPHVAQWLARFHALHHGRVPTLTPQAAGGLWDFGMHACLERRPTDEHLKLPAIWVAFCAAFAGESCEEGSVKKEASGEEAAVFSRPNVAGLGARLCAAAPAVAAALDPRSNPGPSAGRQPLTTSH
jgi:hypothetical protein